MLGPNNICIFQGRLSNDPQYSSRTINGQNGPYQMETALFKIAVDRPLSSAQRQKAKNDNSIKTADFIPISLSGVQVATLRQYFFKGKGIQVVGHYEEYTTKDPQSGETKYGHTFVAEHIGFCIQDPKNSQQNQQQGAPQGGYQQQYQPPQGGYPQGGYQQPAPQGYQQPPQTQPNNGFSMFDESNSPF